MAATNSENIKIMITVWAKADRLEISPDFIEEIEKDYFRGEEHKKIFHRMMTFKDLPCLEERGLLNGSLSTLNRLIIANNRVYYIMVIGNNSNPLEDRSDIESIMNVLEFTSPTAAEPENQSEDAVKSIARTAGGVVFYIALAFCCIIVLSFLAKKTRSNEALARRRIDDSGCTYSQLYHPHPIGSFPAPAITFN